MKCFVSVITIAFFADCTALTTLRINKHDRAVSQTSMEFGRSVHSQDDIQDVLAEVDNRHLMAMSVSSTMSVSYAAIPMSMSIWSGPGPMVASSAMSVVYALSMDYSGVPSSSPTETPDLSHSAAAPSASASQAELCTLPDLSSSTPVTAIVVLEVTATSGTFLDELTDSAIRSVANSFSICLQSSARRLESHRTLESSIVQGIELDEETAITGESCVPADDDAACYVVDLILTVYGATTELAEQAGLLVLDELKSNTKELESDTILAVRVRKDTPADIAANTETGDDLTDSSKSGNNTAKTATIAVLSLLVGSVAFVVIHRRVTQSRAAASKKSQQGSACDDSTTTGDSTTLGSSLLATMREQP